MQKDYYHISAERLGEGAKLPLKKLGSSREVFEALAQCMCGCIRENQLLGRPTVFICPVGPVGQYPFFVEEVNRTRLDLGSVWFFNMDEYLDGDGRLLSKEHPLSFRGFMDREVYQRIDPSLVMPPDHRIFPDPTDPRALDLLLSQLGGADICFGGIGITGHLAFNEPRPELSPEEFALLPTRVLEISPETRTMNAIGELGGALEEMPKLAVTIGMKQILGAKKLRLGVFRELHRGVCRRAAYGEVSSEFPVTLAQRHPDALLYVNDVAAVCPFGPSAEEGRGIS